MVAIKSRSLLHAWLRQEGWLCSWLCLDAIFLIGSETRNYGWGPSAGVHRVIFRVRCQREIGPGWGLEGHLEQMPWSLGPGEFPGVRQPQAVLQIGTDPTAFIPPTRHPLALEDAQPGQSYSDKNTPDNSASSRLKKISLLEICKHGRGKSNLAAKLKHTILKR